MLKLRYVTLIAVVFSFVGSVMMFLIGAFKTIAAVQVYFLGKPMSGPPPPAHLTSADQAMVALVESVDGFLIGIVFFIFSVGIYGLFIADVKDSKRWQALNIQSVAQLKRVLVEMILVVLAVWFLSLVLYEENALQWEILVLPLSIALISLGLRWTGWQQTK